MKRDELSWTLYYGHQLNMSRAETLATDWFEMQDLIACYAIQQGYAEERKIIKIDTSTIEATRIGGVL